jgi:hypothetical protein
MEGRQQSSVHRSTNPDTPVRVGGAGPDRRLIVLRRRACHARSPGSCRPQLLSPRQPPRDWRLARRRCRVEQAGEQDPGPQQDHERPGRGLDEVVQADPLIQCCWAYARAGRHPPALTLIGARPPPKSTTTTTPLPACSPHRWPNAPPDTPASDSPTPATSVTHPIRAQPGKSLTHSLDNQCAIARKLRLALLEPNHCSTTRDSNAPRTANHSPHSQHPDQPEQGPQPRRPAQGAVT